MLAVTSGLGYEPSGEPAEVTIADESPELTLKGSTSEGVTDAQISGTFPNAFGWDNVDLELTLGGQIGGPEDHLDISANLTWEGEDSPLSGSFLVQGQFLDNGDTTYGATISFSYTAVNDINQLTWSGMTNFNDNFSTGLEWQHAFPNGHSLGLGVSVDQDGVVTGTIRLFQGGLGD